MFFTEPLEQWIGTTFLFQDLCHPFIVYKIERDRSYPIRCITVQNGEIDLDSISPISKVEIVPLRLDSQTKRKLIGFLFNLPQN